jgi:hypothetical protein
MLDHSHAYAYAYAGAAATLFSVDKYLDLKILVILLTAESLSYTAVGINPKSIAFSNLFLP